MNQAAIFYQAALELMNLAALELMSQTAIFYQAALELMYQPALELMSQTAIIYQDQQRLQATAAAVNIGDVYPLISTNIVAVMIGV